MTRSLRWASLILMMFALSLSISAAPSQSSSGGHLTHALVVQSDSTGAATLAHYQVIAQTTPLVSMDSGRLAAILSRDRSVDDHAHDTQPILIQLLDDATNAVVYQTVLEVPSAVRGEFHFDIDNPTRLGFNGSNIVRQDVPLTRLTFPVRVPVIAGASQVVIQPLTGARLATRFDLRTVSGGVSARATDIDPVHEIEPSVYTLAGYSDGPVDNRVDILIMGDGYTQSQLNKFRQDAKIFADGMFAITPYKTYKAFFNVRAVYAPSKQSGADRPPFNPNCNDTNGEDGISCCRDNNPSWSAQTRLTRYNSTFCWSQIARLMVAGDSAKVFADADFAYPDWDEIWIIVNDTTYGGSGGELAAASIHPLGVQIQQHEVGHSLLRLADEYGGTATTLFCNDKDIETGNDCPFNITNVTKRADLKWNYWVSSSTPIPTGGGLSDPTAAGLWKGAGYTDTAGYRACFDCIMRTLGRPFGKVAAEQLPLRLYQGGWEGAFSDLLPAVGVSMIDNFNPANSSTWNIPAGGSLEFSAVVVGPTGKKIEVVWLLNGIPVRTEKVNPNSIVRYTLTPVSPLTEVLLSLQVTDIHATLHPTNRILSRSEVVWTVNAAGAPNTATSIFEGGGFEAPSGTNEKRADGWVHKNLTGGRKCGDGMAATGECYYQLAGVSGKVGTLKRTMPNTGTPYADAGDLLVFSGLFKPTNLTPTAFEAVATLVWSDGTKTKVTFPKLPKSSPAYLTQEARYQIAGDETRTLASYDLTLRFKTVGGKVATDLISVQNYPNFVTPVGDF